MVDARLLGQKKSFKGMSLAKSTARELNQRGLLYRKQHWTRDLVLKE